MNLETRLIPGNSAVLFGTSFHWTTLGCLLALASIGLTGCGAGNGRPADPPETAPGTYNFTVTATSGSVQTQSAYTLVVQ
jgi:Putative Ig domain